jgi:hypothetical protein
MVDAVGLSLKTEICIYDHLRAMMHIRLYLYFISCLVGSQLLAFAWSLDIPNFEISSANSWVSFPGQVNAVWLSCHHLVLNLENFWTIWGHIHLPSKPGTQTLRIWELSLPGKWASGWFCLQNGQLEQYSMDEHGQKQDASRRSVKRTDDWIILDVAMDRKCQPRMNKPW